MAREGAKKRAEQNKRRISFHGRLILVSDVSHRDGTCGVHVLLETGVLVVTAGSVYPAEVCCTLQDCVSLAACATGILLPGPACVLLLPALKGSK